MEYIPNAMALVLVSSMSFVVHSRRSRVMRPPSSPLPSRSTTTIALSLPPSGHCFATVDTGRLLVHLVRLSPGAVPVYGSGWATRYGCRARLLVARLWPPLVEENWVKAGDEPAIRTIPAVEETASSVRECSLGAVTLPAASTVARPP